MKRIKITLTLMAILLFSVNLSVGQIQDAGELKTISLNRLENKLEVQIELDKLFNYESFTLLNPNRLVIDLLQVEKFSSNPYIEVNDLGIKSIRTAKNRPDVTRVVFDLAEKLPSYTIKEDEKGLTITFWFEEEVLVEEKLPEIEEEPVTVEKKEEVVEEKEKPVERIPSKLLEEITKEEEVEEEASIAIGFNNGLYFMQGADFQNVYGKSAFFIGGEMFFKIPLKKKEYIGASLAFQYIPDSGLSTLTEEEVKLRMTPISFSALYLRQYGVFSPYVGFGVDYFNYKEIYPETFAIPSFSGSAWGINFQLGTYIELIPSLSLKLYFKYHNARAKEEEIDVNLGGNEYGLGLAYHFKI